MAEKHRMPRPGAPVDEKPVTGIRRRENRRELRLVLQAVGLASFSDPVPYSDIVRTF
jgi:hypothetical protein